MSKSNASHQSDTKAKDERVKLKRSLILYPSFEVSIERERVRLLVATTHTYAKGVFLALAWRMCDEVLAAASLACCTRGEEPTHLDFHLRQTRGEAGENLSLSRSLSVSSIYPYVCVSLHRGASVREES